MLAGCSGNKSTPKETDSSNPSGNNNQTQSSSGNNGGGSVIDQIDWAKNWKDRRMSSLDAWPLEDRKKIPPLKKRGQASAWLKSKSNKSGLWKPPENWKDSPATEVDSIQVTNYGGLDGDPATVATMAAFERETGIKVDAITVSGGTAVPKMRAVLSAKEKSPHVFDTLTTASFSTFVESGYLEPVDAMMSKNEMWNPYDDNVKEVLTSDLGPTKGTHLYGGPNILWVSLIHYRPDLFKKVGLDPDIIDNAIQDDEWTWDLLEKIMKKFKGSDVYGHSYKAKTWGMALQSFKELLYQQGGTLQQDDGSVAVNKQPHVTALENLIQWRKKGWVPSSVINYTPAQQIDGLLSGDIAMFQGKVQFTSKASTNLKPGSQYRAAIMPKANTGPKPDHMGLYHINNYSMNAFADDADKAAAALYMDCRWSYESQWHELTTEKNSSYMHQVYTDAKKTDSLQWAKTREKQRETVKAETFPSQAVISEKLGDAIKRAIAGELEPKKALDGVQSQVDAILDQ